MNVKIILLAKPPLLITTGLSYYFLKVYKLFDPATAIICSIGTFDALAADAAEDLMLCPLKIEVSIPGNFRYSFNLLMVFVETAQYGFMQLISKLLHPARRTFVLKGLLVL